MYDPILHEKESQDDEMATKEAGYTADELFRDELLEDSENNAEEIVDVNVDVSVMMQGKVKTHQ